MIYIYKVIKTKKLQQNTDKKQETKKNIAILTANRKKIHRVGFKPKPRASNKNFLCSHIAIYEFIN